MAVTITCPHCGAAGNAPEGVLGQNVRCSKCKSSFVATAAPALADFGAVVASAPSPIPTSSPPAPIPAVALPDDDPRDRDRERQRERSDAFADAPSVSRPNPVIDFLLFRRMVAPILIMLLFWAGTTLTVLACLAGIAVGLVRNQFLEAAVSFFGLFLGPLCVRVVCEVFIVIFRINETLTDIRNRLERQP